MRLDELAAGGIAMAIIGFLVGAIVMTENPSSDCDWASTIGTLLSAFGAFAAAAVALHLAGRDAKAQVNLHMNVINTPADDPRIKRGLEFVAECVGRRPVTISALGLGLPNGEFRHISDFSADYQAFHVLLHQGQVTSATITADRLKDVVRHFDEADPDFSSLQFIARLPDGPRSAVLSDSAQEVLQEVKKLLAQDAAAMEGQSATLKRGTATNN